MGLLLCACAGGQTGDTDGNDDTPACTKRVVETGLDRDLPDGYTPRDLIEVFDGASAPGFLFPSHTAANDRSLEPEDALAMMEVTLSFEPTASDGVARFEGERCTFAGFTVYGTLTATTLDGEIVLSVEGGLAGPPENASFWSGELYGPTGAFPSSELYGAFPSCNPDVPPITAWVSGGTLVGNLCTSEGLVRFPTACGGYAQAALDEDVAGDLPLPSAVLERLQGAELEVAWSERSRSPLELTIMAGELACYEVMGYDDDNERPAVVSTTAADVAVAIEDVGIAFQQTTTLMGSSGYQDDSNESVSRLQVCTDVSSEAVAALNERLDVTFRHVHACLSIIVREDESLEIALELSGGSTMPRPDTEPPEPAELRTRVLILEGEP